MSCESLQSSYPFTHEVYLDDEPIRKFRSLREAKWFTSNKNNARIEKLAVATPISVFDLYEEAPF